MNVSKTRQAGPFYYEVVRHKGKWRARELKEHEEAPWLITEQTRGSFDAQEDALAEIALWRRQRRQSAVIGFR